jgi:hypothetical protein
MVGGHFATNITAKKNIDVRYWWPNLFKNTHEFCKSYDNYKKIGGLKIKSLLIATLALGSRLG